MPETDIYEAELLLMREQEALEKEFNAFPQK
jgi:hypothetical protein